MTLAADPTEPVRLREANAGDLEHTFAWQCEPGARQHFRQPAAPTRSEHEAWFRQRLRRSSPALWIVEVAGQPVGSIRLDAIEDKTPAHFEVSILIAAAHRGKGRGTQALKSLRSLHPDYDLVATISPNNEPSIAAFKRAGFRKVGRDRYEARRQAAPASAKPA